MRITRIRSQVVDLPLPAPFHPAWARGRNQTNVLLVLVSVETDAGLIGYSAAHAGLEAAITVERFISPYWIGQDPTSVEPLSAVLRDAEILGPPAYFMEIALWDIIGKQAGLPVYKLWGGAQNHVAAYCATAELRSPEQRVEDIHLMLDQGYRAVKLRFHHDDVRWDLKVVEAIRKAVGNRIEIMIDANQAGIEPGLSAHRIWGFQRALAVARELEQLEVLWLEEPLPRYDYAGLARLRERLDRIKIAGGEDNHGIHEFKLLVDRGCFDILQPDALLSEGIFQLRKVAAMAEAAIWRLRRIPGAMALVFSPISIWPPRRRIVPGWSFRTTRPVASPPPAVTRCCARHYRSMRKVWSRFPIGPASASSSMRIESATTPLPNLGKIPNCAGPITRATPNLPFCLTFLAKRKYPNAVWNDPRDAARCTMAR